MKKSKRNQMVKMARKQIQTANQELEIGKIKLTEFNSRIVNAINVLEDMLEEMFADEEAKVESKESN